MKHWPNGWFLSPDMKLKKQSTLGIFVSQVAIFLAFISCLVLVFLFFQFWYGVNQVRDDFAEISLADFDLILNDFGAEIDSFIVSDKYLQQEESLLIAFQKMRKLYSKLLIDLRDFKLLSGDLLLVFNERSSVTDFLQRVFDQVDIIKTSVDEVSEILNSHEDILKMSSNFNYYLSYFEELDFILQKISSHQKALMTLLGDRYPRRYILLLQNNYEIRPTGGFIGGYLIFDMNEGYLENLNYHDVYELDGQLVDVNPEQVPEEIRQIAGNQWGVRDANISPDFPVSGAYVQTLLEQAKGDSVDPVIAIDLSTVESFLNLIGEIYLPTYDLTLNKDNFASVLSFIVESKLTGDTSPKLIFDDLIPVFVDNLLSDKVSFYDLSLLFTNLVQSKSIQAFSKNSDIQAFFRDLGVASEIDPVDHEDYLQVLEISVGGNKTDRWLEEKFNHETLINEEGQILNQLTISRRNTMNNDLLIQQKEILTQAGFSEIEPITEEILFTGINKTRFRIYVPMASQLSLVEGIAMSEVETKFDEDLGLPYFAFETSLPMDSREDITLVYSLPFKIKDQGTYRLLVAKQAGQPAIEIKKTITLEGDGQAYKFYPQNFTSDGGNHYSYQALLDRDLRFGAVVGGDD